MALYERPPVFLPVKCLLCNKNPREQLDCKTVTELTDAQVNEPTLPCSEAGKKVGNIVDKVISPVSVFNNRGYIGHWPQVVPERSSSKKGKKNRKLL